MVDRDEGLSRHQRDRLGRGEADHDAADQPRPRRRRDAVDLGGLHAGALEGASHDPVDSLDMSSRRDLRHDAAIGGMRRDLAENLVRQDFRFAGAFH